MSKQVLKKKRFGLFRRIDTAEDAKNVFIKAISCLLALCLVDISVHFILAESTSYHSLLILILSTILIRWRNYFIAVTLFVVSCGVLMGALSFFKGLNAVGSASPFFAFVIVMLSFRVFEGVHKIAEQGNMNED